MRIVGLTGGMGSGKTTVANFFKELGVPVYIADDAGKSLMNTNAGVKSKIVSLFGKLAYSDGHLDRKYIASQVFNSPEKLQQLNQIVHPAVGLDFKKWKNNQDGPYVIYEAAILFEAGGYKNCDLIILVTAPLEERIKRLQARDKSSLEEIEARIQHQWSDGKKRKLSNFEIINNKLSSTKDQVRNLHEILINTREI
ncbi:dephospho-CoA kinase [Gillisia sp. Hel_I_86]|uniref:dephospho-CoA kinase n=1 Tax=Gillisia sp. Hel_I_86 TaxID=1249981 RepID=UPI00119B36A4|nr:dephospho-CoA kinase [Gillisia sp. Hel_I_86]TVZ25356.1 dephospho-CoA kinase [Gillisia sp. Hel_I_86]